MRKVRGMYTLKALNDAMEYIESMLCAEVDLDTAARIAGLSLDSLNRFFSYMTGMTLTGYVRCRRLSLAADDLRNGTDAIVDMAVKYGYDSAAAFSRAFARQHGIGPSVYRKNGGMLKVYPPASFHIMIKGAKELNFRIIDQPETEVAGIAKLCDGQDYESRNTLRRIMWSANEEDIPRKLCGGSWNQPGDPSRDGIWYGVWQDGMYMIARSPKNTSGQGLKSCILPAGTYAAFETERGVLGAEVLPKLTELILDAWLPSSGYRQKNDLIIEVHHLWTEPEDRRKKRYYEVWIPIEKA